jgi:hypothetical protein
MSETAQADQWWFYLTDVLTRAKFTPWGNISNAGLRTLVPAIGDNTQSKSGADSLNAALALQLRRLGAHTFGVLNPNKL